MTPCTGQLDDKLGILAANPAVNRTFNTKNENLTEQSLIAIDKSVWDFVQVLPFVGYAQDDLAEPHTYFLQLIRDI